MIIFALIIPVLFFESNSEFFDQANKEMNNGYQWHYIGSTPTDPKAKSISLEDTITNEKRIFWKLKPHSVGDGG